MTFATWTTIMKDQNQRSISTGSAPGPTFTPRRVDFRRALWITGGLLIAATAIFQVYDVMRRLDIVVETAERSYLSLSRTLSEQTALALGVVDVAVRDTATDRRVVASRQNDPELQRRLRQRIVAIAQILDLVVLDANGKVSVGAHGAPLKAASLADPVYFTVHRDKKTAGLYVSEPTRHYDTGQWTIALSRRIEGSRGNFLGVAAAFIDLEYFRRFYAALDLGPGSEINLMMRDGSLIARHPGSIADTGRSFADQPVFAKLLGSTQAAVALLPSPADGRERIYAAEAVASFPLAVGASVKKAAVLEAWYVQAMHSAVRTSILCLSVMLLMWLVLRELRRREQAEEGLRVQTALLDELFESAPEAIVMLDLQERVTRVNREFSRMFGYTAAEAQGRPLIRLIVPDDLLQDAERMARSVAQGQHANSETARLRKDGTRLHVSVLGAPILTGTGQIASYAIYRDITERRLAEAERTKLETRLRQAEKLEAIGTMAGGIAHDFNNILAAILGYGDMALNAAPEGKLKRHVGNVMSAAHRARALVDQILSYSRSTNGKHLVVNAGTLVEETLELVRASLPAGIDLHARLTESQTAVIADPTHIHQLVMNLCTNAVQAMDQGGTLSVTLDTLATPFHKTLSHGLLPAGQHVRLGVHDTGCGMEPAVVERIFEHFFTTKESGTGTGLGLALVHGIVTELGGVIDVASRPGRGSAFEIYLPRTDATAMVKAESESPLPRGSGERVLLVEDEKPLMLLAEEMLAALSYEPAGFTRAPEALAEFRADPWRFDMVALDHLMPGMTGIELSKHLRMARSDSPIVLISGYTGPLLSQEALSAGIDEILTKPLDFRQLAEAMARILTRETAR